MTERALLIAIGAIALVLVFLTLVILVGKAYRESSTALRRRRRKVIEPALLRFIRMREGQLGDFVSIPSEGVTWAAAVDVLLEHASILRGDARDRITVALEQIGLVDLEIGRLRSRSWWHRASAAERLGLARSTRAIEPLTERLEDTDPEVRLRAARALGEIRGRLAVLPLVRALSEPSRWSTLRVADILSTMGAEAEEELIRAYPGLPRAARIATIDVLGRLLRPSAASFLQQRLEDEDPDIRARAAHALGQISDPTTHRSLIRAMRDPEWPVRAMAAKALGRLRAREATDALAGGLRDREWWVRSNSALALKELGEPGTRALLVALDSPDEFARQQAVLMLQESGVIDRYVESLAGDGVDAPLALEVISKVASLGQTDRLMELARTHREENVRDTLAGVLQEAAEQTGGSA
jgi:HEAT repeat protein